MHHRSLPRRIARSLTEYTAEGYSPDGLDEAAIDALIQETQTEFPAVSRAHSGDAVTRDSGQSPERAAIRRLREIQPDAARSDSTESEAA
jgi:hypothetical protein